MSKVKFTKGPDGRFTGSVGEGNGELQAKNAAVDPQQGMVKKDGERPEVYHTELATPDNYKGDVNKLREENAAKSREGLAKGNVIFDDKNVLKHEGDGYFSGDASEYEPKDKKKKTALGARYEDVPDSVALNRLFTYQTRPYIRDKYVVVGDLEKDNGKIEGREIQDTGMYGSYIDKEGVRQKYPHPTNIVDFHPDSLNQFTGESNSKKRKIMMHTCNSPGECMLIKKEMKEKMKKWREENVKKNSKK